MVNVVIGLGTIVLITLVLWDAFETIVLPRRVSRRFRFTHLVYSLLWPPWVWVARRFRDGRRREFFLGLFGPLALLILLSLWVLSLLFMFGVLQWSIGSPLARADGARPGFGTDLYLSGTTIFTLGLGDVTPRTPLAEIIIVAEAGTGFGLLAMVIGYLPIIYQAFSRREVNISLLDARAGSPPAAVELLRRHCVEDLAQLGIFMGEWERWSAELLESHLSYPSLAFFRSQHEHQSWLGALTVILDACALVMTGIDEVGPSAAKLTFAMARHAAVDLCQVFDAPPRSLAECNRLPPEDLERARALLREAGLVPREDEDANRRFLELRNMYEPYVGALALRLELELPTWVPSASEVDDWKTSVWEHAGDGPTARTVRLWRWRVSLTRRAGNGGGNPSRVRPTTRLIADEEAP